MLDVDFVSAPLNGDSKELASFLAADVEMARTGRGVIARGAARRRAREVCAREAIVGEEWCVQLVFFDGDELRFLRGRERSANGFEVEASDWLECGA